VYQGMRRYLRVLGTGTALITATLTLQAPSCLNIFGAGTNDQSGPAWDFDGDLYSTAVETDPPNIRLYAFNTAAQDPNWSLAIGTPLAGHLQDGIHFPPYNNNYYSYSSDPATRQWATRWTIYALEDVARRWDGTIVREDCYWNADSAPQKFGVGDLSYGNEALRAFGDSMYPHNSHRNGLDVDLRYLRFDRQPWGVDLKNHADSLQFDVYATADLLNCFLEDPNVTAIFIDTTYTGITPDEDGIVRHWDKHWNHFHVRYIASGWEGP
jgi:hypothetical protein